MRCIETDYGGYSPLFPFLINRNMRCIETVNLGCFFNLAMRLIETWDVLKLATAEGTAARDWD